MSGFDVSAIQDMVVGPGFRLAEVDPGAKPGMSGDTRVSECFDAPDAELEELQERLYANHRVGRQVGSVLLVLQGMDTAGKGGVVRHVMRVVDPQGVKLAAFSKPTEEEFAHHFLWRVRPKLPGNGMIGVFDRSHYEGMLGDLMDGIIGWPEAQQRYGEIREFEEELRAGGMRIIKVMLHISKEFQKENLLERIEDPKKRWKYDPFDLEMRARWEEYQRAYEAAMVNTSTPIAPWYCIPGNHKKYARMVIKHLLLHELRAMDLQWPPGNFDPEVERQRLLGS